jgi:hypothetical protein
VKLPGWVTDNKTSVEREAALWRNRTEAERAAALAAACSAAAKILRARTDSPRVFEWVDPLPASSVAALKRLRLKSR